MSSSVNLSDVVKGGEGSRGGNIIGRTEAGKPIYASGHVAHSSPTQFGQHHKKFTDDDHYDAMVAHSKAGKNEENADTKAGHYQASERHAGMMQNNPHKFTAGTRNGHAVFGHDHEANKVTQGKDGKHSVDKEKFSSAHSHFSPDDHEDAAAHHRDMAAIHSTINPEGRGHKGRSAFMKTPGHKHEVIASAHSQLAKEKSSMKKSVTFMEVIKSGEGSRGGNIIGHTKSGKPIYESASHSSHKKFSVDDHLDAAEAHDSEFVTDHHKKKPLHFNAALAHRQQAKQKSGGGSSTLTFMEELAQKKGRTKKSVDFDNVMKGGEGTRGGTILGHTSTGKAIYGKDHAAYSGFRQKMNAKLKGNGGSNFSDDWHGAVKEHFSEHLGDYDKADHQDAAAAHSKLSNKLKKQGKHADAADHMDFARQHHILGM